MTPVAILLLLALVSFGFGVVLKGVFWLFIIGGALLIAAVVAEVLDHIRR